MRVLACGFIAIVGNTEGNSGALTFDHVSLGFSDPHLCYLQVSVCPASECINHLPNHFPRSSFSWLAQKKLSLHRDNCLYIVVGQGVRQRCQRNHWVKGQISRQEQEWLLNIITYKTWLWLHRHIRAWRNINVIFSFIKSRSIGTLAWNWRWN